MHTLSETPAWFSRILGCMFSKTSLMIINWIYWMSSGVFESRRVRSGCMRFWQGWDSHATVFASQLQSRLIEFDSWGQVMKQKSMDLMMNWIENNLRAQNLILLILLLLYLLDCLSFSHIICRVFSHCSISLSHLLFWLNKVRKAVWCKGLRRLRIHFELFHLFQMSR